jgi:hypothetical protein
MKMPHLHMDGVIGEPITFLKGLFADRHTLRCGEVCFVARLDGHSATLKTLSISARACCSGAILLSCSSAQMPRNGLRVIQTSHDNGLGLKPMVLRSYFATISNSSSAQAFPNASRIEIAFATVVADIAIMR